MRINPKIRICIRISFSSNFGVGGGLCSLSAPVSVCSSRGKRLQQSSWNLHHRQPMASGIMSFNSPGGTTLHWARHEVCSA